MRDLRAGHAKTIKTDERRVNKVHARTDRAVDLRQDQPIRSTCRGFVVSENLVRTLPEMKIYLAGPLFSTAEREFNARLAELLQHKGHEVWLPQAFEQRTMTAKQIFEKDVEGVEWADVVVANMDGPDPDSGTCWECGYAHGKKPVIVYRTDFRIADDPDKAPFNLMLTESATRCLDLKFAGTDSVAQHVHQALTELPAKD